MGPAGAVLFVVVVMLFEMVPLFPTQPLSLASGLLFGAQKVRQGAAVVRRRRGQIPRPTPPANRRRGTATAPAPHPVAPNPRRARC